MLYDITHCIVNISKVEKFMKQLQIKAYISSNGELLENPYIGSEFSKDSVYFYLIKVYKNIIINPLRPTLIEEGNYIIAVTNIELKEDHTLKLKNEIHQG